MARLELKNIKKMYGDKTIVDHINLEIDKGEFIVIVGPSGCGKSTLLRILAGMQNANKGTIDYNLNNTKLNPDKLFSHVSFCAPGMDIIEEMSLKEFLNFHFTFKPIIKGFTVDKIIEAMGLQKVSHKFIHDFSSGMKQRVKLAQAIFFDTPIVLLDEPCSNLDTKGIELYHSLVEEHCSNRLVVVCSNDPVEYSFCQHVIAITDHKLPLQQSPYSNLN